MSSLAKGMRAGPPQRVFSSPARHLAWAAVVTGSLPWSISVFVIRAHGFPGSLKAVGVERCVQVLVASGITVIVGLIASLIAEKEDTATRQIASVAVVLSSFTILIAGALLAKAMQS